MDQQLLFGMMPLFDTPQQIYHALLIEEGLQDESNVVRILIEIQTALFILDVFIFQTAIDLGELYRCLDI